MPDGNEISGDDYFSSDTTVAEDLETTEAEPSEAFEDEEGESPSEELEDAPETAEAIEDEDEPEALDEDADDPATDEWLPGFEGRFRVGEEAKALASYQELEKAYSRKDAEMREQLAAEREAAFKHAKELLTVERQEPTWQELETQRGQLLGLATQDPTTAFQYALDSGDEGSINAVIKFVAEGSDDLDIPPNPGAALEMQRVVSHAQTQAAVEAQNAQIAEFRASQYANEAKTRFEREYGQALEVPELQQELSAIAQAERQAGKFDTSSPDAIYGFLEDCLTKAYGRLAMKGALPGAQPAAQEQQTRRDPNAAKRAARLESGVPTRATRQSDEGPTPEEAYADDLLGIAKQVNPGYRI